MLIGETLYDGFLVTNLSDGKEENAAVLPTAVLYRNGTVVAAATPTVSASGGGLYIASVLIDASHSWVIGDHWLLESSWSDPGTSVAKKSIVQGRISSAMRGTDSALLAASAPTNFGDLAITASSGKVTVGANDDKTGYSISGTITTLDDVLTTAMSESYAADGATFSVAEALYEICQILGESGLNTAGTLRTILKRDGTTTALTHTVTRDGDDKPTKVTRVS